MCGVPLWKLYLEDQRVGFMPSSHYMILTQFSTRWMFWGSGVDRIDFRAKNLSSVRRTLFTVGLVSNVTQMFLHPKHKQ